MSSPEAMRRLADMVEALRDVEGIEVDTSSVEEVPSMDNPMQAMMGQVMGADVSTEEKLVITADMVEEEEDQMPDDNDAQDDDFADIEISDDEAVAQEASEK